MSELIQEPKYITVDEFMPKWTQAQEIKEEKDVNAQIDFEKENNICITDSDCCMIGEVHGGDTDYDNCPDCYKFSFGRFPDEKYFPFGSVADAICVHNGTLKEFYQFKEKVYNHFMEAHPEKLLRK